MNHKGRAPSLKGFLGLFTFVISVKDETVILDRLQQHNAHIRHAMAVNGRQCHSVGIIQLTRFCVAHPITGECKRIVAFENSSSFFHVSCSLWVDAQGVLA